MHNCVSMLLSLHSLYQCTFRLYCILCAAFGVIIIINEDDDYEQKTLLAVNAYLGEV